MKKVIFIWLFTLSQIGFGQLTAKKETHTLQDTLRGSITPERAWWNLKHYHLSVRIDPKERLIVGTNTISYEVLKTSQVIQIDLQKPLEITKITQNGVEQTFTRNGNVYLISLSSKQIKGESKELVISYFGKPRTAKNAPWDGGFSWAKDQDGGYFVATSCQGLGASVWWPCKDHMYDEPENGMTSTVTVPLGYTDVSNGKLIDQKTEADGWQTYTWAVKNPINNYGVNLNIAKYIRFGETYIGEKGPLSVDYFVLPENLAKAKEQFKQVPEMLKAFEHWFGPYPFYEDGFKLVEVPYLGMEHQSSVTYGNKYRNGYLGRDLSGSGWGLKWDFIIVHESGHEWFANNITYKDIADMWIHESFTAYSESLFTEYYYGKAAGDAYVKGTRANILNDRPIIGVYNVNKEGSGDMYYKGSNILHMLRQYAKSDDHWRSILRGLNADFYHQTVTSAQIENYLSEKLKINLSKVFDQYLRHANLPKLEQLQDDHGHKIRFVNVVPGFELKLKLLADGEEKWECLGTKWVHIKAKTLEISDDFLIEK
jgi:aminopeptidase N